MSTPFPIEISSSGWRLVVKGQVQGVGFRPFIYNLVNPLGYSGRVYNSGSDAIVDVICEVEEFQFIKTEINKKKPSLARIDALFEYQLSAQDIDELQSETQSEKFYISESAVNNDFSLNITPDTGPCENCLDEMFDPTNRRYLYPFINCTQCGPRYTIVKQLPYDRKNTSMAHFKQCGACDKEYKNPISRRFHAQPNACEECGPSLWHTINTDRVNVTSEAPKNSIQVILDVINQGGIVAMRSVGGFHLVCDAKNSIAVEKLRKRKRRPTKPFAIMVANIASAKNWVELSPDSEVLIHSQSAPIVIADAKPKDNDTMSVLAPGLNRLGVMLPQSPLHWLLFYYFLNQPNHPLWKTEYCSLALVMTSANSSGEPLITDNGEAEEKLANIADAFLFHDRDIVTRCDDSVFSSWTKHLRPVRLGRGYSPLKLTLPPCIAHTLNGVNAGDTEIKTVLALGSYLKNTVALNNGLDIILSQHVGDLDHPDNCAQLDLTVYRLLEIMKVTPDAVACDMHPEGYGRQLAERLCKHYNVPLIDVPHHVAHVYAGIVELNESGNCFGIALDGFGYGWDGALRGGELFFIERQSSNDKLFQAIGHVSPIALPGGDKSAKEPWRLGISLIESLMKKKICDLEVLRNFSQIWTLRLENPFLVKMLHQNVNCPETTSLGRWFDAIAGLLGICSVQTYEGEAAMKLEALAIDCLREEYNGFSFEKALKETLNSSTIALDSNKNERFIVDLYDITSLLVSNYVRDFSIKQFALDFHVFLAKALANCIKAAGSRYPEVVDVVLSGGCIQNRLLSEALMMELKNHNYNVHVSQKIPVNDGGISVGQIVYSLKLLSKNTHRSTT